MATIRILIDGRRVDLDVAGAQLLMQAISLVASTEIAKALGETPERRGVKTLLDFGFELKRALEPSGDAARTTGPAQT